MTWWCVHVCADFTPTTDDGIRSVQKKLKEIVRNLLRGPDKHYGTTTRIGDSPDAECQRAK